MNINLAQTLEKTIMRRPKIYADGYQTALQIFHRTKSFPKALRPTLGRKMEEAGLICLMNIQRATLDKKARIDSLKEASNSLDELRTLIQLAKDLNAINIAGLSELSGLTKELGKEIGGFIKFEDKNIN